MLCDYRFLDWDPDQRHSGSYNGENWEIFQGQVLPICKFWFLVLNRLLLQGPKGDNLETKNCLQVGNCHFRPWWEKYTIFFGRSVFVFQDKSRTWEVFEKCGTWKFQYREPMFKELLWMRSQKKYLWIENLFKNYQTAALEKIEFEYDGISKEIAINDIFLQSNFCWNDQWAKLENRLTSRVKSVDFHHDERNAWGSLRNPS